MPSSTEAVLQDQAGRAVLRLERVLDHPIERVWRALTELAELRAWHPSPFELELRAGGSVRYVPPQGHALGDGRVTDCDPPRLLAYEWGEDHLRWELEPRDEGTRLVLTHTFDDRLKAARDAAGWDLCLDALVAEISTGAGQPTAEISTGAGQPTAEDAAATGQDATPGDGPPGEQATIDDDPGLSETWTERNHHYEQRFGIAPADATPPPARLAACDAAAPLLMFTGQAEEAMRFYASVFFPARIERIERYGDGDETGIPGTVKHATLRLGDRTVHCIDSPPVHPFTFTPAISLAVHAASEDAVDAMFARLSDGGAVLMPLDRYPFSERFAWLTDRFGVSWQVSWSG